MHGRITNDIIISFALLKLLLFNSLKDGAKLAEDARVVINRDGGPNGTYEITIKKVQAGDAGTYSVVASNDFGKAECSAKIGVKGKRYNQNDKGKNKKETYTNFVHSNILYLFCIHFGQMPKTCLLYSKEKRKHLQRVKNLHLHGSNLVKNLTLKIVSRSYSKMKRTLLLWCSSTSTLRMLACTPVLHPLPLAKSHAQLSSLSKEELLNY